VFVQPPLQHAALPPGPALQRLPHAPQLAKLFCVFTHAPLQQVSVCSGSSPTRQRCPQRPQESFLRLTQAGWRSTVRQIVGLSAGHTQTGGVVGRQSPPRGQETQEPEQQLLPDPHVLPHTPQLESSDLVATQVFPQSVLPVGQTHLPTRH
jgi:hypothetical protein